MLYNARLRLVVLVCTVVLACRSRSEPEVTQPVTATGWYRAVAWSPVGVGVAFLVQLPSGNASKARFRSGSYSFDVDATVSGSSVRIDMPVYGSTIVATRVGQELIGTIELYTPFGGRVSLRLTATPVAGPEPKFLRPESTAAAFALEGGPVTFWRVDLDSGSVGKLTLNQISPGAYEGVLALDNGNITNLGGVGVGDRLVLSGFDGTAAYQLDVTFPAGGDGGRGTWTAGQALDWHEKARLHRSSDFEVRKSLDVTGPLGLPVLEPFLGKPVLVEIGASWCSTCSVVAPVLRSLYERYHARGLEAITLLYEFSNDAAYDQKQAQTFQKTYDIPWQVVAITGEAGEHLPKGLGEVDTFAFPLLLVLARDGSLRSVRAGFPMDSNDAAYGAAVEELRASIDAVVSE